MPADITNSRSDKTASTVLERSRRRSERVVLRVPVELSAMMPHDGKRIYIQAHTLVVNAHGGLLDVGIEMVRGQRILLNNLKTKITASGRVLRVEASEQGRFSAAFEFESPAPHFWPVSFPPADWRSPEATD